VEEVEERRTPQINSIASFLAPQWRWPDDVSLGIARPGAEYDAAFVLVLCLDDFGKFMWVNHREIIINMLGSSMIKWV
jgi:hypothetical protein